MTFMLEAARVAAKQRADRHAEEALRLLDNDTGAAVHALLAIAAQLDRLACEYERDPERAE